MDALGKKIEVLERRVMREKKARLMAEVELEEYSRNIYQANVELSNSLDITERRQQDLEFLNEMASQIVLDNSLDELVSEVLGLFSVFVDANFGMVFDTHKNSINMSFVDSWQHPALSSNFKYQCQEEMTSFSQCNLLCENEWRLSKSELKKSSNQTGLLSIYLNINTDDGYLLLLNIPRITLVPEFMSILNTARDLLRSGLRRRQYEAKIVKRNQQLHDSIINLERLQSQLIHSEKMASLGQLAAGIAHEINNPVGYITANTEILSQYVIDIQTCLQRLHLASQKEGLSSDTFEQITQEFELSYIVPDMQDIIEANRDGVGRIKNIVSGLSTFSHPGESEKSSICLVNSVDVSLKLVENELKYKHIVDNKLPQALPKIEGNHGQLQQVFVIMIVNAVHAMPDGGTLTFSHSTDEDNLTITIGDTGCGIPNDTIDKIFTPFYTTKPVGSGTGLGLSITHAILEDHQASVKVTSEVGKGTQFHLTFKIV